jgi:ADP-ribosylglycohydrolase
VAEEALATALLCVLLHPNDPVRALRQAATTSGDSDSIAAIAGALAGAHHGISAWPADWVANIEYADRIERLASAWDNPT